MNVKRLLLILIFLTPLFGIADLVSKFKIDISINVLLVKIIKDILIILIIIIAFFKKFFKNNLSKRILRISFPFFIITLLVFLLNLDSNLVAILGVRWIIPIFLIFVLVGEDFDDIFFKRLSSLLLVLLIINFGIQILQIPLNLTRKLTGFFTGPSSCAIFVLIVFYVIKYFSKFNKSFIRLSLIISGLSIILTQSSLGIIIFSIINLMPFFLSNKKPLIVKFFGFLSFSLIISIIFLNIGFFSGRKSGAVEQSANIRLEILKNNFNNLEIVSTRFGEATNSAVNYKKNIATEFDNSVNNSFIADSMFIALLVNYGFLPFIFICFYLFMILIKSFSKTKDLRLKIFLTIIFLSMLTTILTEVFPVNIIAAIISAHFFKNHSINET